MPIPTSATSAAGTIRYRWAWSLRASPEALWPLVADTNRFDKDARLPAVNIAGPEFEAGDNGRRVAFLRWMGQRIEWVEEPFEWVRPRWLSVTRHYRAGPLRRLTARISLSGDGGGTRLVYELDVLPANLLGRLAAPIRLGRVFRANVARALRSYDEEALASERRAASNGAPAAALLDSTHAPVLAPGAGERLESAAASLRTGGVSSGLVERLVRAVRLADDLDLHRMRPYAFAARWGTARRETLELFLGATRAGMLELQWEILCPMCRGSKSRSSKLSELAETVHCDACRIDFTANFDQLVELTFRPNPAIRPLAVADYCIGSPQITPHIVVQQLLDPGESIEVDPLLDAGRHRLRASHVGGGLLIDAQLHAPIPSPSGRVPGSGERSPDATASAATLIPIRETGWPAGPLAAATHPRLALRNETGREQLVSIERLAWTDEAATAAEVTALQSFRDLFSTEALRPGQRISVGAVTLLFTDLRGSTAMYREIGDAPAFGTVMTHFDILKSIITRHDGAVIKTIGDAVMAVFRNPAKAVRAALESQQALAHPRADSAPSFPSGGEPGGGAPDARSNATALPRPLALKAAIHTGPCIAVTLNDRLDYFGSTVNIAARLVAMSSGEDVVISGDTRADAEVGRMLAAPGGPACGEAEECALRGIADRTFLVHRVARRR